MYKSEKHTLFVPNLLSSTISAIPCPLHQEQVCDQQDAKSTHSAIETGAACRHMCFIGKRADICLSVSVTMAVWLQAGALLFLLVVPSVNANSGAPQHLCGSHLVDALYLVCGPTGFFYNPKRDVDPLLGK